MWNCQATSGKILDKNFYSCEGISSEELKDYVVDKK